MGTKGTLILDHEQEVMLFDGANTGTKVEVKTDKDGKPTLDTYETGGGAAVAQAATAENVSRGYTEEIEHWAWCIRNPAPEHQPRCQPEVAMADAVIALTTNIAIAKGGRIEFKHEWFDIDSDATPDGSKPAREPTEPRLVVHAAQTANRPASLASSRPRLSCVHSASLIPPAPAVTLEASPLALRRGSTLSSGRQSS